MVSRAIAAALVLALLAPALAADRGRVVMIVNRERKAELSLEDVAQIYLRRRRFWQDGAPVVPLNLPPDSPLRERFSQLVLQQSEERLAGYWNRLYFRGILPPATLASTESVRRYVASDPNAIGYVLESEVDGTVRVLLRLE